MNSDTRAEIEFARRSRQLFQGHLAQLDDATRAKLKAARLRAVEAAAEPRPLGFMPPRWVTAGAFGALAAAVVTVWMMSSGPGTGSRTRLDVASSSDLELLLGGEDFDVVQNLEFYAWLEEQRAPKAAAKKDAGDKSG